MTERIVLPTTDGHQLVADLHLPEGSPKGLALLGHAMMVDRRTMDRPKGHGLASVLVSRGFAVLNVDFRGHGESVLHTGLSFSFDDIVRVGLYLTDLSEFAAVNAAMEAVFDAPYPARSTIQVSALPRGAKFEVDAIMVLR